MTDLGYVHYRGSRDELNAKLRERDDAIERLTKERDEAIEALKPFALYAEKRTAMPVLNLGDSIHTIHGGTEWEGQITFSDCMNARSILSKHEVKP